MTLKKLIGGRDNMDRLMRCLKFWPDDLYLKLMFRAGMGRRLDLNMPRTFNEKLQWLKLHDRSDIYHNMADKYEAKKLIAQIVGDEYVVPALGVWNSFSEIDFDKLPERFVLKCTHDSGSVSVCRDRKNWDMQAVRKKFEAALKHDFFWIGREWPYRGLKRRIIAEEYLHDDKQTVLKDYKVFCFDGQPGIIMTVCGGHNDESETVRRMYTPDWQLYDVGLHGKAPVAEAEDRPEKLDEMLELARRLSAGVRHLRVDLYLVNGRVYVGELTFYHMTGMERFVPESYDAIFGKMINLG